MQKKGGGGGVGTCDMHAREIILISKLITHRSHAYYMFSGKQDLFETDFTMFRQNNNMVLSY